MFSHIKWFQEKMKACLPRHLLSINVLSRAAAQPSAGIDSPESGSFPTFCASSISQRKAWPSEGRERHRAVCFQGPVTDSFPTWIKRHPARLLSQDLMFALRDSKLTSRTASSVSSAWDTQGDTVQRLWVLLETCVF